VREAQSDGQAPPSNLATVYDIGVSKDRLFVVMEIVDGGHRGRLAEGGTAILARDPGCIMQAACGLTAAHAGASYTRLQAENVLYGNDRRRSRQRLRCGPHPRDAERADPVEGMAERATVTKTGGVVGPWVHRAEILRHEPVDERADQFSFCGGAVPALHGERPFERIDGQSRIDETSAR